MRHDPFGTRLRHGLIACTCGVLLSLGSAVVAKAQTQAQDDDEDTFEQRIIKGILGGLGVNVGGAGIEYRERSPLVIPPNLDLPPPDTTAAVANPAWPKPQERKKVAKNVQNTNATSEDPGTSSRLTPTELRRGINPSAQRITDRSKSGSQEEPDIGRPSTPKELGWSNFSWRMLMGSSNATETARFEGEPTRGSLTQPPVGYQTPSSAAPYGVAAETPTGWKIPSILSRPEGSSDN